MEGNAVDLVRWAWICIGLLFLLAEVFTAGFVLACFGVGAFAAAVPAFLGLGFVTQLLTFIVVSTLAVLFSRRFADRVTGAQPQGLGVDRVLGKQALVIETIDPDSPAGRVRVDVEEWRADSVHSEVIPEGTRVEVLGIDGTRLRVRPLPARGD
jgi:membrane protein implicated in regulation of membrane protease activity